MASIPGADDAAASPSFTDLGVAEPLADACLQAGFAAPTPIQQQALPVILQGRDVLALAPTGSGKTAAFVLPLVQQIAGLRPFARRQNRVLVLAPTRELASQVGEVFRELGRVLATPPKVAVLAGGVSINPQMMSLRGGVDVVVATPGRLLDLVARNALRLARVDTLVLDEADRLLDPGFADEVNQVLQALPARRQNLLFSATFAPAVQALAGELLRDAVQLSAAGAQLQAAEPPAITQRAIAVDTGRRTQLLLQLARDHGWRRVLVFVATRHATEHVARKLSAAGLPAAALHGELSQGARSGVLAAFKAGQTDVLVTTDLAARGIDIPGLEVVVNYDLPRSPADHVHRIGRTGRAGASGLAVSFVSAATEAHFRLIEKRQGLRVAREQVPGFEPVEEAPADLGQGVGGIKGKRPSKKDKLRAAAAEDAARRNGNGGTPRG